MNSSSPIPEDSPIGRLLQRSGALPVSAPQRPVPRHLTQKKVQAAPLAAAPKVRRPASVAEAAASLDLAAPLVQHEESYGVVDADGDEPLDLEALEVLNPGPPATAVVFGPNCGSCSSFLALNDPRRDDPAFMESYFARSSACPMASPELVKKKYPEKELTDCVVRATDRARRCFKVDRSRASKDLVSVLEQMPKLSRGELDIITVLMVHMQKIKSDEERLGYRIGQSIPVLLRGRADQTGVIAGFDGNKLIVSTMIDGRRRLVTMRVPEAQEIPESLL